MRTIFALVACGLVPLCAAETETIFTIRNLKGEMRIYSSPSGDVLPQPKKSEDAQSDPTFIQKEIEGGQESFYVSHNNGRRKLVPIVGEKSISFLESYGDNNFIWTVCLDTKNSDGSFLVIYTSLKAAGVAGFVTTSVMSGGAYTALQARPSK